MPHDDRKQRKQWDRTALSLSASAHKKKKCLAYVSHVSDVQCVSHTQLDISNIYTSKFCTKPRLIWTREKGQRKSKRVCVGVCDRVIGAQQKWYLFVYAVRWQEKRLCVAAVYALCGFKERQPKEICPLNLLFFFAPGWPSTSCPFLLIYWHYSDVARHTKTFLFNTITISKKCKRVIHSVECF